MRNNCYYLYRKIVLKQNFNKNDNRYYIRFVFDREPVPYDDQDRIFCQMVYCKFHVISQKTYHCPNPVMYECKICHKQFRS